MLTVFHEGGTSAEKRRTCTVTRPACHGNGIRFAAEEIDDAGCPVRAAGRVSPSVVTLFSLNSRCAHGRCLVRNTVAWQRVSNAWYDSTFGGKTIFRSIVIFAGTGTMSLFFRNS